MQEGVKGAVPAVSCAFNWKAKVFLETSPTFLADFSLSLWPELGYMVTSKCKRAWESKYMTLYLIHWVAAREKDVWNGCCQMLSVITTNDNLKKYILKAKQNMFVAQVYLVGHQFVSTIYQWFSPQFLYSYYSFLAFIS